MVLFVFGEDQKPSSGSDFALVTSSLARKLLPRVGVTECGKILETAPFMGHLSPPALASSHRPSPHPCPPSLPSSQALSLVSEADAGLSSWNADAHQSQTQP